MIIDYLGQQKCTGTRISRIRVSLRISLSFSERRDNLCGGNGNRAFSSHLQPASGDNSIKGDVNFLCSSPRDRSPDAIICTSIATLFSSLQLILCPTRVIQLMPAAFNISGGYIPVFHLFKRTFMEIRWQFYPE